LQVLDPVLRLETLEAPEPGIVFRPGQVSKKLSVGRPLAPPVERWTLRKQPAGLQRRETREGGWEIVSSCPKINKLRPWGHRLDPPLRLTCRLLVLRPELLRRLLQAVLDELLLLILEYPAVF
jgi:hypothetical protein